jgi:membrane protein implicated in regulation of membrane protease activity
VALNKKAKSILRNCSISFSSITAMAAAIIGANVNNQGGNFWPWAIVSFAIYALEMMYLCVAAYRYYNQPEQRRQRNLVKQRRGRRANRISP